MIANKSTKVASMKTIGEIQAMLAHARASSIMVEYEDGEPIAISFQLKNQQQTLSFRLPINWKGTLQAMIRDKTCPKGLRTNEQARRVSWRVLRDWIRAQLTLVEAGASTIHEVMVPWMVTNDGTTVTQRLFSGTSGLLALPAPKDG